jgi:hypothetical protein
VNGVQRRTFLSNSPPLPKEQHVDEGEYEALAECN